MDDTSRTAPAAQPSLWSADDLAARDDWVFHIDAEGLDDIAAALVGVKRRGIAADKVTAADFPLPSLAATLAAIKHLLSDGLGLALLRGLPVERYAHDDLVLILAGLGSHIGTTATQSASGDLIVDVMDMTHAGGATRAYSSPRPQDLHCDSVDVTGLLCLRPAKAGGTSLIASSAAVFNAILAERPDLMPALRAGFHYRRSSATATGEPPLSAHRIPVFGEAGGRLVCYFNPDSIGRALAQDDIDNDAATLEAFEVFNATAARDGIMYQATLAPGDLQFLNNRMVMHGRTAFDDYDEVERKRLILRLWLKMPDWPDPPAAMALGRDRAPRPSTGDSDRTG